MEDEERARLLRMIAGLLGMVAALRAELVTRRIAEAREARGVGVSR